VKEKTSIAAADDDRQFAANEAEEIRRLLKKTAETIVIIGQKLTAVKARLKHGEWGDWLRSEFDWDPRTAQRFMNVGERFKNDNLSDLNIAPSALYLLAAPSTPEEVRESVLDQAKAGERITHSAAQQAIDSQAASEPPAKADPCAVRTMALALGKICVLRLYREGGYATFEECLSAKFDAETAELINDGRLWDPAIEAEILASPEFLEMKSRWGSLSGALKEYVRRREYKMGKWLADLQEKGIYKGKGMTAEELLTLAPNDIAICSIELAALGNVS
jgi:hypothetical protein